MTAFKVYAQWDGMDDFHEVEAPTGKGAAERYASEGAEASEDVSETVVCVAPDGSVGAYNIKDTPRTIDVKRVPDLPAWFRTPGAKP